MESELGASLALGIVEKLSREAKQDFVHDYQDESLKTDADLGCWLVERTDLESLRKILDSWIEALKPVSEDVFAQGVATGLIEFDSYLEKIEEINNRYWAEVGE